MIDLPDLKTALRIAAGHTAEDDYITALEVSAVEVVENDTLRFLGPSDSFTVHVEGRGTRDLYLPYRPLTIGSLAVTERVTPDASGDTLAVNTDFVVRGSEDMQLVRLNGLWKEGYEYQLTYDRGYAPGDEPDALRLVVEQLVGHWYENRIPAVIGTVAARIPMHVAEVLAASRRWNV